MKKCYLLPILLCDAHRVCHNHESSQRRELEPLLFLLWEYRDVHGRPPCHREP